MTAFHPASALTLQDFSRIFSRHLRSISAATIAGAILFTTAAFYLPKKYKANFVLTIYSKYFQSPLIGEFVPELSESGERSQRESLIREIFTTDYLDSIGRKYGIYGPAKNDVQPASRIQRLAARLRAWCVAKGLYHPANPDARLSADREGLRARFEIYSLNNTTFNVSFLYSDPDVTLQVVQDAYARLIQSLLDARLRTMVNVRDAIRKHLDALQLNTTTPAPLSSGSAPDLLNAQEQLKEIRRQLQWLTAQYTDEHPLVKQLRAQEKTLVDKLAGSTYESGTAREGSIAPAEAVAGGSADQARDISGDLARKYNYLNIAIETDKEHQRDYFAVLESPMYPVAPLWPNKGIFLLWGAAVGLFGSFFIVLLRDYYERSALHAIDMAQRIGVPLIGEMPSVPGKARARKMLIAAPQQKN